MNSMYKVLIGLLSIVFLVGCSTTTQENVENYPDEQISLVVPFDTGGASDMVSRAVAMEMENELGVPVVIINKTGGSGAIGVYDVMASSPDGYRIGYVPVELSMYESLEIANVPPEDFEYLSRIMTIPPAITVPADAPYDTLEEFLDYAEEHPGEIQIGNSGTGSIWHIAAAALAQETGTSFNYVPFEGAAPAVSSLLGGHIDAVSVSPSEVKAGIDGGDLKVLAVMGEERDPIVPDVPTLQEEGIDLTLGAWGGFVAPKDTPQEIVDALDHAINKSMETDTFKRLAETNGLTPAYLSNEDFKEFVLGEYDFYNEFIPTIQMQ
ncbi:tripartite tricarboxylate transporter substrate binding protein [Oceanobacillus timonensis]|uniref:tripartite tricarboxylate transporter substrate binding protein n=1 Tax=Oceanobacillus timonensis TaxID=1926285 RepID=UPI0009B9DC1C|nr:tripartite tricarboxylate transporter substrate binding protein [Oceanobacillus timonensis]